MPVERHAISVSQLAELLGVDPARFVAVEKRVDRTGDGSWRGGWYVVTEGDDMQTSGTMPQLSDNTSKRKPKGKGKGKGC